MEVRYFDIELMEIVRGFLECSKKEEFYNNVMMLKEFVENLRDVDMRLKMFKGNFPIKFEEIKYLFE
ncbi:hypothetical protein MFS40622_0529 [Methanocaldococcus sp. FS406-22]|nr:hypothetical protein MFS40622_0529 [Methanocaldococcus sp. FS406-22]